MKRLYNFSQKCYYLLLVFLLIGQGLVAQEFSFPETPVGKIAKRWFEAYASDDDKMMRDFTANYRTQNALDRIPIESRMAQHKQFKGMLQALKPQKALQNTDKHLVIIAFSQAVDSWFEISFLLNDATPPKLESFGFKPSTAPLGTENDLGEWNTLSELLQNAVSQYEIPGLSMAVIDKGQIAHMAVAGVRAIGTKNAIELDDRFHIGSITKSMTATLIAKLIEEQRLTRETTLQQVFPDIDMLPVYHEVTIEQLMHHTAGIPAYLTVTDEQEKELLSLPGGPMEQRLGFAKQVLQETPATPLGTFAYSNAGYSILGTIAEQVTEEPWDSLLTKYIFSPLGMTEVGIGWPKTKALPNQPAGHFGSLKNLKVQSIDEYELGPYLEPAGDVNTSIKGLALYAQAHLNGMNGQDNMLKADTYQWLHNTTSDGNYAGGWFVTKSKEGKPVIEHAGSAGTFMAYIAIEPETNQAWVIAANTGDIIMDTIFRKIIETYRLK